MTQEDKQLLFADLCARLQYGVKVEVKNYRCNSEVRNVEIETLNVEHLTSPVERYRPYLRPMSSITEEEIIEFNNISSTKNYTIIENDLPWQVAHYKQIEWLNKKMFDFRGLIPKDLAISTEIFNPYKD